MNLPPVDGSLVFPVASHECGHYVVARVLGFQPSRLSIVMLWPNGHRGESEISLHKELQTKQEILDFLDKRAQILCAGVMAEATKAGVLDNARAIRLMESGGGADQDFAKYREIIYLMRNIKYGASVDEKELQ